MCLLAVCSQLSRLRTVTVTLSKRFTRDYQLPSELLMRKINFDCLIRFDRGERFGFDVLKQKFLIRRVFKIKTCVKEKITMPPGTFT